MTITCDRGRRGCSNEIGHHRRTFPECAHGTGGVALFEGRVIGRVRLLAELPRDPKPWMWSVTDPTLAGQPGWADTQGEVPSRPQAMDRLIERWQELRRLKPTPPGVRARS